MFSRMEAETDGPREPGQHTSIPARQAAVKRLGPSQGGGASLSHSSFRLWGVALGLLVLRALAVTPQGARDNWAVASGAIA